MGTIGAPILWLDRILQAVGGVHSFDEDAACIVRISEERCRKPRRFGSEVVALPGQRFLTLHLWNERLGDLRRSEGVRRWPEALMRGIGLSLHRLALHCEQQGWFEDLAGCHAAVSFKHPEYYTKRFQAMGFIVVPVMPVGWLGEARQRFHQWYTPALTRAIHGEAPRGRDLRRIELWLPADRLKALASDGCPQDSVHLRRMSPG